jgi:Leucine-rich repeat (LRR) protein
MLPMSRPTKLPVRQWFQILSLAMCVASFGCKPPSDSMSNTMSGSMPKDEARSEVVAGAAPAQPARLNQLVDGSADVVVTEWQSQIEAIRKGESDQIQLVNQILADEDLADVESLDGLTSLLIDAGVITDLGLASIAKITKLEHLRLRESPITDAGMALLARSASGLQVLNLPQAKLTAEGIKELSRLPNLTQLRLGGAQIDDEAVGILATLPALRSLHLIGPRLSDAALDALAKSPKLASLYLDDCELSDAAWERLFVAKPNVHVHINQAHHDRDPSGHEH